MFIVISLMLLGICVGYFLQKYKEINMGKVITSLIWILLFLLGVEVGGNQQIIKGFANLGLEAVLISFSAVLGSCLASWSLWRLLYKRKGGEA